MLNRMIYSQLIHQMVGGIMRVYLFHGNFYALLIWKTRPNTKSTLQCNLMKVKWLIHRHSTVFRRIAPCPVNCGHLCITLKPFSNFSTAFASRQQMNFEREKNASSSHFPSSSSILINKLLFWTLEWKKTRLHCEPKAFALASLANCLALWSKLKWLYADTNTATIKNAKIYSILLAQKKSRWKPLAFFFYSIKWIASGSILLRIQCWVVLLETTQFIYLIYDWVASQCCAMRREREQKGQKHRQSGQSEKNHSNAKHAFAHTNIFMFHCRRHRYHECAPVFRLYTAPKQK